MTRDEFAKQFPDIPKGKVIQTWSLTQSHDQNSFSTINVEVCEATEEDENLYRRLNDNRS